MWREGPETYRAGFELGLLRGLVVGREGEIVRRLVEAPVTAPMEGQEAGAFADRLAHERLGHRLAAAGGDLDEVSIEHTRAPRIGWMHLQQRLRRSGHQRGRLGCPRQRVPVIPYPSRREREGIAGVSRLDRRIVLHRHEPRASIARWEAPIHVAARRARM